MILAVFSALMRKAWTRILWPAPSWPHSSCWWSAALAGQGWNPRSNLDIFIFLTNNCCSDLSLKNGVSVLLHNVCDRISSAVLQLSWVTMVLDRYSNPNNRLIKELLLFDTLAALILFSAKPKYLWVSLVLCLVIELTALYLTRPASWVVWETVLS